MFKNSSFVITVLCLMSYVGVYYIGYHHGKFTIIREFAEYARETDHIIEQAIEAVQEATKIIEHLHKYEECKSITQI